MTNIIAIIEKRNKMEQIRWILNQRKDKSNCYKSDGKFITRREAKKMVYNHEHNITPTGLYGTTNNSNFGKIVRKKIKKKLI